MATLTYTILTSSQGVTITDSDGLAEFFELPVVTGRPGNTPPSYAPPDTISIARAGRTRTVDVTQITSINGAAPAGTLAGKIAQINNNSAATLSDAQALNVPNGTVIYVQSPEGLYTKRNDGLYQFVLSEPAS